MEEAVGCGRARTSAWDKNYLSDLELRSWLTSLCCLQMAGRCAESAVCSTACAVPWLYLGQEHAFALKPFHPFFSAYSQIHSHFPANFHSVLLTGCCGSVSSSFPQIVEHWCGCLISVGLLPFQFCFPCSMHAHSSHSWQLWGLSSDLCAQLQSRDFAECQKALVFLLQWLGSRFSKEQKDPISASWIFPNQPSPPHPTGMATQCCCVWVSTTPSHRNLCKETFWQLIPMHRVWESFRERLWPHRVPCLHVFFPSEHSDCCSFCWFFTF